jgi:hypothetical protein
MTASAGNIADLTVAVTVEIGINANKQTTTIPSLYNAMPLAVLERNAKEASQPCHFDLNWFLKGGLDAIDVTGISSRPRRKENVQGWTPAFTLVILHSIG